MAPTPLQEPARWWSKDTVAVVTGSNKGLGYAIVQGLARRGVTAVLTSRDTDRGLAAVESAEKAEPALAELIHFHQLDINNEESVSDFAVWLKSTFGGFDILINNASVAFYNQVYEEAVQSVEANYYGTRRVTEKLLPLLRASPHGARIVNISTRAVQLQENFQKNEYLKTKIHDAVEHLDKGIVDALAAKYLEDAKAGRYQEELWANNNSNYVESKLFVNMWTQIVAKEVQDRPDGHRVFVNGFCPGLVESDMFNTARAHDPGVTSSLERTYGVATPADAAKPVIWLALLPPSSSADQCAHGEFYAHKDLFGWWKF